MPGSPEVPVTFATKIRSTLYTLDRSPLPPCRGGQGKVISCARLVSLLLLLLLLYGDGFAIAWNAGVSKPFGYDTYRCTCIVTY